MHLPPLDVAIYPATNMSRGICNVRPARPSSTISSSSSSSSTSQRSCTTTPDFLSIQKAIRSVFRSSRIAVEQAEQLPGRLHQVYRAKLADGGLLVLKCPPAYGVRTLRHEKLLLENESKLLDMLHQYTQVPAPKVLKYDSQGGALGMPFFMMSHLPGRRLSEMSSYLSASEQSNIERKLGTYVRALTALSATQFGMTHRVFAQQGSNSWREAFLALLEAVLRDAEDMLVTLDYDSVRHFVRKNAYLLDEVTEPRLVALNVCDPTNVLIDDTTRKITGLVGFSSVIWGDRLMISGMSDGSPAFFEGLGERPGLTGGIGARARMSMYATYRAIVKIVTHHARPYAGIDDIQARREMVYALKDLAAI